jgi:DNA topoisomerase II
MEQKNKYKRKAPIEHVLLRPEMYVGSMDMMEAKVYVIDEEKKRMELTKLAYVPGLLKLLDEILVNAADSHQRDPKACTFIKVSIDREKGSIQVENDGARLPVEFDKDENMYIPQLIFGEVLTGENFDDEKESTVGGRHGLGAKLTNIFSTKFMLHVEDSEKAVVYKQVWEKNMTVCHPPSITPLKGEKKRNLVRITAFPDCQRFQLKELDPGTYRMMIRRVYDIAGTCQGLSKVRLDGKKLAAMKKPSFSNYIKLFTRTASGDRGEQKMDTSADEENKSVKKMMYDSEDGRWQIAILPVQAAAGSTGMSFVNRVWTRDGGTHVNLVMTMLCKRLITEKTDKKSSAKSGKGTKTERKTGVQKKHIKKHMMLILNCLVNNPCFDSQSKDRLTRAASQFGSKPDLDKLASKVRSSDIMKLAKQSALQDDRALLSETDGKKKGRVTGLDKLSDANWAGTAKSNRCTLILTEGDSAKTLAMHGLSIVGRDAFGVFALKGKFLNVREATLKQLQKNTEVAALKKILGLQQDKKYDERMDGMRYHKVLLFMDKDVDGSHIAALVTNFFALFWPELLQQKGFLSQFVTPLVRVKYTNASRGSGGVYFYNVDEFKTFEQKETKKFKATYLKGLGSSTPAEAKMYFRDFSKHHVELAWTDKSAKVIEKVFAKNMADERKKWLLGTTPIALHYPQPRLTIPDFVDHELIHYSLASNDRSIPSMVDGCKPSVRKILFSCFQGKVVHDMKVVELAGYVSKNAAYHHGEKSLTDTIVGLAQNYPGSNNINYLVPSGQFGSRYEGGHDAAAPRYIHTCLEPITRRLFRPEDDAVLQHVPVDGQLVEPVFYVPVLPAVLINGCEGIGTGWSTSIPPFNPRDLAAYLIAYLAAKPPAASSQSMDTKDVKRPQLIPWYRGFRGTVKPVVDSKFATIRKYQIEGVIRKLGDEQWEITELPIGTWINSYKQFLEKLLDEKKIKGFSEHHQDDRVRFVVRRSAIEFVATNADHDTLLKAFKLTTSITTSNMMLFDALGKLKKYATAEHIMDDFIAVRLTYYEKRKEYLVQVCLHTLKKLSNQLRFVRAIGVDKTLDLRNQSTEWTLHRLQADKYDRLESTEEPVADGKNGYKYLLLMPLWAMTVDKIRDLQHQYDQQTAELKVLEAKTIGEFWQHDLNAFLVAYDRFLATTTVSDDDMDTTVQQPRGKKRKASSLRSASS